MCASHNLITNLCRSSKCYLINSRVFSKICSNIAKSRNNIDNSIWKFRLFYKLSYSQSCQRSLLSCLHNYCASCSKSWAQFPRYHCQWKIPWDDLANNSNWLLFCISKKGSIYRKSVSSNFINPSGIIPYNPINHFNIHSSGNMSWLSIINRL